mmetsp:Transcript_174658/g.560090  ORF Transcript_174658/g.560090 Transcript_174658/m.560090 type:complete len:212 (+) Transcript_174658:1485-2120(+)
MASSNLPCATRTSNIASKAPACAQRRPSLAHLSAASHASRSAFSGSPQARCTCTDARKAATSSASDDGGTSPRDNCSAWVTLATPGAAAPAHTCKWAMAINCKTSMRRSAKRCQTSSASFANRKEWRNSFTTACDIEIKCKARARPPIFSTTSKASAASCAASSAANAAAAAAEAVKPKPLPPLARKPRMWQRPCTGEHLAKCVRASVKQE